MNETKIKKDIQDRTSCTWEKLCSYIDRLAKEGGEEFWPSKIVGNDFHQIYTLPESIGTLKNVKKMILYGSSLHSIPPEIGQMEALEEFIPYTSESLNWFPYEITHCKKLKRSTVSTRVIYGNYKNRKLFPDLTHNPVRYHGESLKCSVCLKTITYDETQQYWISLMVATDVLPLLVNACSTACLSKLALPPEGYLPFPHKGGIANKQPANIDKYIKEYRKNRMRHPNGEIPILSLSDLIKQPPKL